MRQRVRNIANAVVRPSQTSSRTEDIESGLEHPPAPDPTIFINVGSRESDGAEESDHEELQCNNVTMYLTFVKPSLADGRKCGKKVKYCIRATQVTIISILNY